MLIVRTLRAPTPHPPKFIWRKGLELRNICPIFASPNKALSGALNIDAVLDCYEYRPFSCLAKPVTKELLIENIEKALLQVEYNSFH